MSLINLQPKQFILSKDRKSFHVSTPLISLKDAQVVGMLHWGRHFFGINQFFTFFQAEAALWDEIYLLFVDVTRGL